MNDRNEINYPLTVHWIEDILLVHWGNIRFSLNRKAALMMAKALTDAIGEADISYALEAVNNHDRLTQRVQELENALRAVLDDDGLADVIAAVGEGEPPFMQQVRAALAGKKESDE
jgi:hypothetical protein